MQILLNDLPYTHTQKKEAFTRNGSQPQSYNQYILVVSRHTWNVILFLKYIMWFSSSFLIWCSKYQNKISKLKLVSSARKKKFFTDFYWKTIFFFLKIILSLLKESKNGNFCFFQTVENVASLILGKLVFVNWPHLEEARVVAVSDGETK